MKGIDVSNHNGSINFGRVKDSGIEAVYIKATEGTTFKDRCLEVNYSNAHCEGLKTGFYHFLV
ncbi:GH25 family lysozyme, partial [Clostridium beijerinckii]